jgi:hypothetical protein
VQALAQVHCHQHAVLGWDADQQLLEAAGVSAEHLESGCCGLAGNFGFTAGHGEVSVALAEQVLLPRLRSADPDTVTLADGFSCRTQIHQLDSGGHEGVHVAELIAAGYGDSPVDGATLPRHRPEPPHLSDASTATKRVVVGVSAAAVLAAAASALSHRAPGKRRPSH